VLLSDPSRWHQVQQHLNAKDFANDEPAVFEIAKRYWTHQRDEGEPVLNEFLSLLDDAAKSLAIELVQEVEALGEPQKLLNEALAHMESSRKLREEKKTVAALRRTVDQHEHVAPDTSGAQSGDDRGRERDESNENDEVELLRRLAAHVARPDIRRV